MNNKLTNMKKGFTASLHTHVRSIYDASMDAKVLCSRLKEMGAKGLAITDHGVVSAIEDFRGVFQENNLKLIPGCEFYVDGGALGRVHLVGLSVNDHGWKGIGKLVTAANKNIIEVRNLEYPVLTEDVLFSIMKEYKGDIIFLSGCMQGVLSAIYLTNNKIEKKIAKIQAKQTKYLSEDSKEFQAAKEKVVKAEENLQKAIENRDSIKMRAEQKFVMREKKLKKMENNGDDVKAALEELEFDKKDAEQCTELLPKAKEDVEKLKKELSAANKELQALNKSADMYASYQKQIEELKENLKDDVYLDTIARSKVLDYCNAVGKENFFMEVQYHGIPEEAICFPKLVSLAREYNLQIVATNDAHIITNSEDDRLRRQILRSLRFGEDFEAENQGDKELYLKTNEELAESLLQILPEDVVVEAINNIDVVFNRCDVEFKTAKHYPKFAKTGDADTILDAEIEKGIKWRFPEGLDEAHKTRLEYELSIIKSMGYSDYHLIEKDFLEYGRLLGYVPKEYISEAPLSIAELNLFIKEHGWNNGCMTVGPGRGSAVGSLVCYLIGITAIDPLKYDLLFERFLNPERVSMPDIDSDFAKQVRGKVIEYVQKKYGQMAVCGIMTTTMQGPKGSINIAAKFYGYKKDGNPMTTLGRAINKDVPSDVGVTFQSLIDENGKVTKEKDGISLSQFLCNKYKGNQDALTIIKWATVLEGSFTAYGAHAAGIVISDNEDISDYLPLRMNNKLGLFTTQCDMVQTEDAGLLKFDFLGLKTLDIITDALRMVEENTGVIEDPLKINLEDSQVYKEILTSGRTNAVFQFESVGMKAMLQKFKPECFEDLIILVSMFRPGPMQYLDDVIAVKNGKKPMTFLCPELKPILNKTYGAIVYQEQVMEIFQKLAGYTLGQADIVRRYMSKKKEDKLVHEKDSFIYGDETRHIAGCIANGISENVAITIFEQMVDFARYAFNKSHGAAYALNAYITAWLKDYYGSYFFASAINWAESKEIAALTYEANVCGVKILPPSINESQKLCNVINNEIRFGLSAVAGVKDNADIIIEERKNGVFTSLKDFCIRIQTRAAEEGATVQVESITKSLISAGAFDSFGKNREAMQVMVTEIKSLTTSLIKKRRTEQVFTYLLPLIENCKTDEEVVALQEKANLPVEVKTMTTASKLQSRLDTLHSAIMTLEDELNSIRMHDIKENKSERMRLEKKFLGIYITEHPMDYYPAPEKVGTKKICDITEGDNIIYGVISNLTIKERRSDGAKMAFFTIDDRSGSMKVAMFTRAYDSYSQLVAEGNVVKIFGHCDLEEFNEEEELKFYADKLSLVQERKSSYLMGVSSLATFHMDIEKTFRSMYEDENGHPFLIFDQAMGEVREMNYSVVESVKNLPNVEEIFC